MIGETVHILRLEQIGVDDGNMPVYAYPPVYEPIENVLVAPGSRQDLIETIRPDGVVINYTLHFPKTFDERLKNRRILVRGRECKVVGDPDHYMLESTPTPWWMPVEVTATDG